MLPNTVVRKLCIMATRDVRSYFQNKAGCSTSAAAGSQPLLISASDSITPAEMSMVHEEVKEATKPRTHYNKNLPDRVKTEIGRYASINGTKSALEHFGKKYPHFTFLRTSVNNWKKKIEKSGMTIGKSASGRPNSLREDLLNKVKDIIVGTRAAGGVISRRMVIAIGNGVVKANDPNILREYGGHLELTEGWARRVLASMNWTKRKGTTGKVDPSEQLLQEEKLTFQKNIATIVVEHDIPEDLILNLDQTPLSYLSPGKYTFNPKGAHNVPIKGVDDKRQITATFAVTLPGEFLPLQVIYQGKTKRCLPKYTFPDSFDITHTENHWSNREKSVDFFKNIVFPYFEKVKTEKNYPKEQVSLVIMDTFKGQDNPILEKLCRENYCEIVIVPHNLTNKFQPLDLTVNKPAKSFMSGKYNAWYADQVTRQLQRGINPSDVKISLKLTDIKVLHTQWIVDTYHYLKDHREFIVNGFAAAGITEAFKDAQSIVTRVENPFRA